MKSSSCILFLFLFLFLSNLVFSQGNKESISLINNKNLSTLNVESKEEVYQGKESLKVIDTGGTMEEKFVKINSVEFKNGIIELEISGKPAAGASDQARGFVGIAFRINDDNSKFECIYLRPTNGRAEDQLRRNHSTQYISFPDFPWHKLREETPGKYESYVDLVPGEWTKIKIEVNEGTAKLYVHGNAQPSLVVNDLKHGPDAMGNIGLWIGPGTEAHFSNLFITTD